MTWRYMPGNSPLEHARLRQCRTAMTQSSHHRTAHHTGQPFATESAAIPVAVTEATGAPNAILAPHRPLRERPDANPEEWKEMAMCKIEKARAKFDTTARRSKKGRQPSPPVPQLWSEDELEEQFVRGSGAGGQKINKTSCCVLITVRGLLQYLCAYGTCCGWCRRAG